jgi:5-hydroxyisourate hydrolase
MSAITTHVLDTSRGCPAAGLPVRLEGLRDGVWESIGSGTTGADGRVRDLMKAGLTPDPGRYRLTFATGAYFAALGVRGFYPEVSVVFEITAAEHYHVPLLLSPYGYATYRGS